MSSELSAKVIFVDLDGTLIATDVLWESLLLATKHDPLIVPKLPLWAMRGRAELKRSLARLVMPDPKLLPYREDVLAFLRAEKVLGRKLVLATASDGLWAKEIAQHLSLFDDILASDGEENLKGSEKLAAIKSYCQAHGYEEFAYVGDDPADVPIWEQAASVYVVKPTAKLLTTVKKIREPLRVFGSRRSRVGAAIRAMRPQQWVKNFLLFVPLLLAHEFMGSKVLQAFWAFLVFSACASSVYLVNDLLDIEADRRHPHKRHRPFASADLPVAYGPVMSLVLLFFGITLAATTLPWAFTGVLSLYLVLTTLYSFRLKQEVVLDVLLLASLYMLRVLAGGTAVNVVISEWLMAFSIFLFMSLAFVKRYAELARLCDVGHEKPAGRGYAVTDMSLIESFGPIGGCLAVLVFGLYINSDDVKQLYTNEWALWLICPLLLYWILRVWFMAKRRELSEDPVVFALTDPVSLFIGGLAVIFGVIATSPW